MSVFDSGAEPTTKTSKSFSGTFMTAIDETEKNDNSIAMKKKTDDTYSENHYIAIYCKYVG